MRAKEAPSHKDTVGEKHACTPPPKKKLKQGSGAVSPPKKKLKQGSGAVSPPKKKLKQAVLKFTVASVPGNSLTTGSTKKRKLSASSENDDVQLVKIIRSGEAECAEDCSRTNTLGNRNKHASQDGKSTEQKILGCISNEVTKPDSTVVISKPELGNLITSGPSENSPPTIKAENSHSSIVPEKTNTTSTSDTRNITANSASNGQSSNPTDGCKIVTTEAADKTFGESDEEGTQSLCLVLSESDDEEEDKSDKRSEDSKSPPLTKGKLRQQKNGDVSDAEEVIDLEGEECSGSREHVQSLTPPTTPTSSSISKERKLTPKQLQKRLQSAKKKEERLRLKEERERKRLEEKEEKLRQKQEKEELKKKEREEKEVQKRKEKEEKEEQKRREKEEKEKKRQSELDSKNEEKRAKEEERKKKEEIRQEEKRKKEEKKLAEEDAKRKKEKEVAAFTSFFVAKKPDSPKSDDQQPVIREDKFMPFQIKPDMRMAPVQRASLPEESKSLLETKLGEQSDDILYLDELKKQLIQPRTSCETWPLSEFLDEVIILDSEDTADHLVMSSRPPIIKNLRPKLLQFAENQRPPYWGTWRKRSNTVSARHPFGKDEKAFDYEFDSDEEWVEEEPGESLHGSDDEKESEDEYDVDNDFMVPHGYLSDEENVDDEEEVESPEVQKAKLKLLELEFQEERKQKMEKLQPRLVGCIWLSGQQGETKEGKNYKELLGPWRMQLSEFPVRVSEPSEDVGGDDDGDAATPKAVAKTRKFPESDVAKLITLIHGNTHSRHFLVKEFAAHLHNSKQPSEGSDSPATPSTSLVSISKKIRELATWMACPDDGPLKGRLCWYVSKEVRVAYSLPDLSLPNSLWTYTLKRKHLDVDVQNLPSPTGGLVPQTRERPRKVHLITKFTKKLSEEDRSKQLLSPGGTPQGQHKRATLHSVKRIAGKERKASPLLCHLEKATAPVIDLTGDRQPKDISPTVPKVKQKQGTTPESSNGASEITVVDLVNDDSKTVDPTSSLPNKPKKGQRKSTAFKTTHRKKVSLLASVPLVHKIPSSGMLLNHFKKVNKCPSVENDCGGVEIEPATKITDTITPVSSQVTLSPETCDPVQGTLQKQKTISSSASSRVDTKESTVPNVTSVSTQRKKVPLLASVPLGHKIPSSLDVLTRVKEQTEAGDQHLSTLPVMVQGSVTCAPSEKSVASNPTVDVGSGHGKETPVQRKRVPLLASVPLGMKIPKSAAYLSKLNKTSNSNLAACGSADSELSCSGGTDKERVENCPQLEVKCVTAAGLESTNDNFVVYVQGAQKPVPPCTAMDVDPVDNPKSPAVNSKTSPPASLNSFEQTACPAATQTPVTSKPQSAVMTKLTVGKTAGCREDSGDSISVSTVAKGESEPEVNTINAGKILESNITDENAAREELRGDTGNVPSVSLATEATEGVETAVEKHSADQLHAADSSMKHQADEAQCTHQPDIIGGASVDIVNNKTAQDASVNITPTCSVGDDGAAPEKKHAAEGQNLSCSTVLEAEGKPGDGDSPGHTEDLASNQLESTKSQQAEVVPDAQHAGCKVLPQTGSNEAPLTTEVEMQSQKSGHADHTAANGTDGEGCQGVEQAASMPSTDSAGSKVEPNCIVEETSVVASQKLSSSSNTTSSLPLT